MWFLPKLPIFGEVAAVVETQKAGDTASSASASGSEPPAGEKKPRKLKKKESKSNCTFEFGKTVVPGDKVFDGLCPFEAGAGLKACTWAIRTAKEERPKFKISF